MIKKWLTAFIVFMNIIHLGYSTDNGNKNSDKNKSKTYTEKVIITGDQEANLIQNPDFENSTSNWTLGKFNGGAGLFTTDTTHVLSGTQSGLIITENTNLDYADVQLFTHFKLTKHTRYSISFSAEVDSVCLISLTVSNGFETYFDQKFLLKPGQRQYGPFNFKSESDDPFTYFAFNLGKTHHKLRFDDVRVRADYTDKKFNKILANSGINLWFQDGNKEFYLQLPTAAYADYLVVFMNTNGKTFKIDKINQGIQEKQFTLDSSFKKGTYTLKVFTPEKTFAYNFQIE